jgi:hypothetical protein
MAFQPHKNDSEPTHALPATLIDEPPQAAKRSLVLVRNTALYNNATVLLGSMVAVLGPTAPPI